MSFVFYVNHRGVEMNEQFAGCVVMQMRYNNANVWDKVLAKMDHLTDPGPQVRQAR